MYYIDDVMKLDETEFTLDKAEKFKLCDVNFIQTSFFDKFKNKSNEEIEKFINSEFTAIFNNLVSVNTDYINSELLEKVNQILNYIEDYASLPIVRGSLIKYGLCDYVVFNSLMNDGKFYITFNYEETEKKINIYISLESCFYNDVIRLRLIFDKETLKLIYAEITNYDYFKKEIITQINELKELMKNISTMNKLVESNKVTCNQLEELLHWNE